LGNERLGNDSLDNHRLGNDSHGNNSLVNHSRVDHSLDNDGLSKDGLSNDGRSNDRRGGLGRHGRARVHTQPQWFHRFGGPLPRLPQLLAMSCLGSLAALLAGRALLERLPGPTPLSSSADLERLRRWSPDPERRREASLLLQVRSDDPDRRAALLAGQGWGSDPLAAVALKQAALNAACASSY
jgi:hypothetical protein